MSTAPVLQGPLYESPENMAEVLRLAYDIEQAAGTLEEAGEDGFPADRAEAESEAAESVKYSISPKEGELAAVKWKPDGSNWTRTSDEARVTPETPFVATNWKVNLQGSHGVEFRFYSNSMHREGDGSTINPVWELRVNARDLDNLKIIEEREGSVTSEWLGRNAVLGAQG